MGTSPGLNPPMACCDPPRSGEIRWGRSLGPRRVWIRDHGRARCPRAKAQVEDGQVGQRESHRRRGRDVPGRLTASSMATINGLDGEGKGELEMADRKGSVTCTQESDRGGHDPVAEVSAANKEPLNGPADPCSSLKNEERPGEWAPHAEAQAPSSTWPQALAIDPPEQAAGVSQGPRARYSEGAERERERETARWVPRGSARGAGSGTGLAALRKAEVGWIGDIRPS
jgi:hypothetical protein